jgi:mRNA interferase RelE/StbE
MYKLKYRRSARNYIARLPLKSKSAIVNKLHKLADNPDDPELDISILKGRVGFRLRIGKYRVIYSRYDDILVIEIVKIRSRGDIYKG